MWKPHLRNKYRSFKPHFQLIEKAIIIIVDEEATYAKKSLTHNIICSEKYESIIFNLILLP